MIVATIRPLAVGCACLALGLGARDLIRSARAPGSSVARRYDRSRFGRRLETTLWAAQIRMTPSAWRGAQLLMTAPVATFVIASGVDAVAAAATAFSVVRIGGRLVLRSRSGRGRDALDAAVPQIARALATELGVWGNGAIAVTGAARRCTESRAASRVLELAAARVALGGEPALSLRRSLEQVEPAMSSTSPALLLPAILALHRHDAAATAGSLDRLAAALQDDRAVRHEVRARVGEVRMSAVAVPLIAGATGALLLSSDPPAQVAALSFPLLPVLLVLVVVVIGAAAVARRLVAA